MKKMSRIMVCGLTLVLLLSGCGSKSAGGTGDYGNYAMKDEAQAPAEMAMAEEGFYEDTVGNNSAMEDAGVEAERVEKPENTNRKLITTMNMSVETEQFDDMTALIEKRVEEMGGYIEASNLWNGGMNSGSLRTLSLTVRIPAEKLGEFVNLISEKGNVVSSDKSVEDVTLTYVDLDSHKKALQTEEARLLELMEQAETMEDLLTIEGRLTELRYQIQSMESQLRTYDNKVDYSTLYLSISEVERITPVPEKTAWSRISTGFMESAYDVGTGFKEFGIGLLIRLPYLLVWAVFILIFVLVIKAIVKKNKKKQEARRLAMMNAYAMPSGQPMQQMPVSRPAPVSEEKKNGES